MGKTRRITRRWGSQFEGTATADLLEALALIASWLKPSLCMIDQVLLVGHVKYRFHPP